MSTFKFEMFTPIKQFYSGEVEGIVCLSSNGELGILKGHYPMTVALSPGEMRMKIDGVWKSAYTADGFMEVRPDEVIVFSHTCEWPEDIDEALAAAEIEKSTEKLRNAESLREYREGEIELQRMMAMLKVKKGNINL